MRRMRSRPFLAAAFWIATVTAHGADTSDESTTDQPVAMTSSDAITVAEDSLRPDDFKPTDVDPDASATPKFVRPTTPVSASHAKLAGSALPTIPLVIPDAAPDATMIERDARIAEALAEIKRQGLRQEALATMIEATSAPFYVRYSVTEWLAMLATSIGAMFAAAFAVVANRRHRFLVRLALQLRIPASLRTLLARRFPTFRPAPPPRRIPLIDIEQLQSAPSVTRLEPVPRRAQ